jgi:hypothetical protein
MATNTPQGNYPNLDKTWQKNQGQIDEQISGFCETCAGDPGQKGKEMGSHVQNWFQNQDMDEMTQNEFSKAKQDTGYWQNKTKDRYDYLNQQGKLKGGQQQQQSGSQSGQAGQGQYSGSSAGSGGQSGSQNLPYQSKQGETSAGGKGKP